MPLLDSKQPLFRHAAYRAIDGLLTSIEVYGDRKSLKALDDFQQTLLEQFYVAHDVQLVHCDDRKVVADGRGRCRPREPGGEGREKLDEIFALDVFNVAQG